MSFSLVHGDIIAVTEKAVLLESYSVSGKGYIEHWIPRSQIDGGDDIEMGLAQDLEVATWFAQKEGLE